MPSGLRNGAFGRSVQRRLCRHTSANGVTSDVGCIHSSSHCGGPGALAYADTPETVRRSLARHDVPGFRLARIATDLRCQGHGIGGQLLAAARRCLRASAEVGGVVLIIDAKNDRAARWYASYGAVPLSGQPLTLVMSLASFAADLKAAGQL